MIYTLTLNPAIDLFIQTKEMQKNQVNRTEKYDIQANGKGINVSFILKRLGLLNTATGVGGGFTLKHITQELSKNGIPNYFVEADGITRINVFTHVDSENCEYKLVNPGPKVADKYPKKLLTYFDKLQPGDIVSLSGSFSAGIAPGIIVDLAKLIQRKGAQFVVDTSYREVLDILPYHPLLLKPNQEEVKGWYGVNENLSVANVARLAEKLVKDGAQNVLLSLGKDGAVLLNNKYIYYGNAPHIEPLNSAGAGDSMLGTFIAGLAKGTEPQINLRKSIAAGSDTTRNMWITDFKHTTQLETEIKIKELHI